MFIRRFFRSAPHQWEAWLLCGVALIWAAFRVPRSFQILFGESHDLYTYYSLWYVMGHRDLADIALRQSLYLPHTWVFVTPFFLFGWPAARILMLIFNVGCLAFSCWKLGDAAGLVGIRRALLLALSLAWLSTGVVIGLGNLALVCVTALVAAYPYKTASSQVLLTFSAMKQSLVFPVYLHLLFRRPRALIIPTAIFTICGITALVWARLTPLEAIALARGALDSVSSWTQYDHTCLRRILVLFTSNASAISVLNWVIWFGLFWACWRLLRDPLSQLAAFLLLSLLPMYHNTYDFVAALPALAVLLRCSSLVPATLLTLCLVGNPAAAFSRLHPGGAETVLGMLLNAYYPLVILITLVGIYVSDPGAKAAAPLAASRDLADASSGRK